MFKNPVARSDSRKLLNNGVGANLAIWANFDVILDYGCGMNGHFCRIYKVFRGFRIIVSCGSCKSCL